MKEKCNSRLPYLLIEKYKSQIQKVNLRYKRMVKKTRTLMFFLKNNKIKTIQQEIYNHKFQAVLKKLIKKVDKKDFLMSSMEYLTNGFTLI